MTFYNVSHWAPTAGPFKPCMNDFGSDCVGRDMAFDKAALALKKSLSRLTALLVAEVTSPSMKGDLHSTSQCRSHSRCVPTAHVRPAWNPHSHCVPTARVRPAWNPHSCCVPTAHVCPTWNPDSKSYPTETPSAIHQEFSSLQKCI